MENAVAVQQQHQIIPLCDIEKMAEYFARSGAFGINTVEQAVALMLVAQAEGRHPASIAMDYDFINGRPAIKSESAFGRFVNGGGRIEWLETTDKKAKAKLTHPQGPEYIAEWDLKKAEQAGLLGKNNWQKYPGAMLRARVVAEGIRACYPACLRGMPVREEAMDFDRGPQEGTFLQSAPVQSAPEPKGEPKTVDATAEVIDTPAPEKVGDTPEGKQLADGVVLEELDLELGDLTEADVVAFLVKIDYLNEGQSIKDLPVQRIEEIKSKKQRFLQAVRNSREG